MVILKEIYLTVFLVLSNCEQEKNDFKFPDHKLDVGTSKTFEIKKYYSLFNQYPSEQKLMRQCPAVC